VNARFAALASASALLLCATATSAEPAERTYVLSLQGIDLGPDEYVSAFALDSWGVRFRAVCHIPPGWYIKAGGTASFDGGLQGEGTHSVTFLGKSRLHELEGLALIALDGPVRPHRTEAAITFTPPTFDGTITVERVAETPTRPRKMPLKFANFRLVPAMRCPGGR